MPEKRWISQRSLIVLTILIVLLSMMFSQRLVLAESLETSVVSLIIRSGEQILEQDDFFEILDCDEYILLPLGLLSSSLDFTVDYKRDQGILVVKNHQDERCVEVDFTQNLYRNHVDWSGEPPVLYNGDFFVTPLLLEYIIGGNVEWNVRSQELTIVGNWIREESMAQKEQGVLVTEEQKKVDEQKVPIVVGGDIALGAIQYKVVTEYRKDEQGPSRLMNKEYVTLYGRVKDWAITLEEKFSYDFVTCKAEYSLPWLIARYVKDDHVLTLGDFTVNLNQTLGQKDVRGGYFRYPEKVVGKLLALTSVSGTAEPGDRVFLFVNGLIFAEQLVDEGSSYYFVHVPLKVNRTNTIRVVIQKVDGSIVKMVKHIAACPRILEEGVEEYLFALGVYRNVNKDWAGQMTGLDLNYALSENVTLNWQLAAKRLFGNVGKIKTGSILGIATRGSKPVVFTLDWLIGGEGEILKQGGETSLLYTFDSGFLEGVYYCIPPETVAIIRKPAGERLQIISEWGLDKILLCLQGNLFRSIGTMSPAKEDGLQVSVQYQSDQRRLTSITGLIRDKNFLILGENQNTQQVSMKEGGLVLEHRSNYVGTSMKGKLALSTAAVSLDQESAFGIQQFDFQGLLYKKLKSIVLGSDIKIEGVNRLKGLEGDFEIESRIKWIGQSQFFVSGNGKISGSSTEQTDYAMMIDETELGLLLQKYFNGKTSLYFDGSIHQFRFLDSIYTKAALGLNHAWEKENGEIALEVGYVSPLGQRELPQWIGSVSLTKYLNSNLKLNLQAQRLYSNLYEEKAEDVITFSISQALGFADGNILGQRYEEENKHNAFISGVVFLDENSNGKLDEGEINLPGIEMFLDGRRAKSNEQGMFIFENVRPGIYEVGFDLNNLVADYTVVSENQLVRIRENENIFLHYGLTMNGSISGKVFVDKNANGVQDIDEEPLAWVGIEIKEAGKKVYTRKDGTFYFENISLGRYTLQVLADSLPEGMAVAGESQYPITLTKDMVDLRGMIIPIIYWFN